MIPFLSPKIKSNCFWKTFGALFGFRVLPFRLGGVFFFFFHFVLVCLFCFFNVVFRSLMEQFHVHLAK